MKHSLCVLLSLVLLVSMIPGALATGDQNTQGKVINVEAVSAEDGESISVARRESESMEDSILRALRENGLETSYFEKAVAEGLDLERSSIAQQAESMDSMMQMDIVKETEGIINTSDYIDADGRLIPPNENGHSKATESEATQDIDGQAFDISNNSDAEVATDIDATGALDMIQAAASSYTQLYLGGGYYGYVSGGSWYEYRFTPSVKGNYTFYSTGSTDTYGMLCTMDWYGDYIVAENDDGGSGTNFSLSYNLEAGQTYKLYVRGYSQNTSGSFTTYVTKNTQQQSLYAPDGGSWLPSMPVGNSSAYTLKLCYWSKGTTQVMMTAMNEPTYGSSWVTNFFNMGVSYVVSQIAKSHPWIAPTYAIVSVAIPIYSEFKNEINYWNLSSAANASNSAANNGVKVSSMSVLAGYDYSGYPYYANVNVYKPWYSTTIYGVDGYTGTFSTSNQTPIFK